MLKDYRHLCIFLKDCNIVCYIHSVELATHLLAQGHKGKRFYQLTSYRLHVFLHDRTVANTSTSLRQYLDRTNLRSPSVTLPSPSNNTTIPISASTSSHHLPFSCPKYTYQQPHPSYRHPASRGDPDPSQTRQADPEPLRGPRDSIDGVFVIAQHALGSRKPGMIGR